MAKPTRRDFLHVATGAAAAAGATATLVPLIDQMNPDAATLAAGGPIDLDLSKIQPGQQVAITWRGKPILVINRTPQLLQTLQDPRLLSQLADPQSSELQQPAYVVNWHRSLKPEYGVLVDAPYNLPVPPYNFVSDTTNRIGENPPRSNFDFSSVRQI